MFGEEHGEEETPSGDFRGCAIGSEIIAAEKIDEGGGAETSEPGEKSESINPRTDGICTPGDRSLCFEGDFKCVAAEFNPIVD